MRGDPLTAGLHPTHWTVYQVLTVDEQRILDIRGCPNRYATTMRLGWMRKTYAS